MCDSDNKLTDPKCFDNGYVSLKHYNIQALQYLIKSLNDVITSGTQHVKACFVTSFGIIHADIQSIQEDKNKNVSFNKETKQLSVDLSKIIFLRNKMLVNEENAYPETPLKLKQDGYLINLKNVEIYYPNSKSPIAMPQLLIYADTILAMSYIVETIN